MAKGYRPVQRDQEFLMPPSMREWLPADHLVWFLLEVIAELDTSVLHRRPRRRDQGAATGSAAGRAGYHPDMLLGLLIYAYAGGHQSSRRIERLCHTDVAFRVLCAGDIPDHTVIARFRAAHQEGFTALFAQVLRLCAAAGLARVGTVAIDGSKFAGNAAAAASHDRDWFAARAAGEAAARTAAAAATDAAEDDLFGPGHHGGGDGPGGDRIPHGWVDPAGRAARLQRCLDELTELDAGPGSGSGAGAVDPGAVDPGAVDPGVVNPGVVNPGAVDPGVVNPGVVDPGAVMEAEQALERARAEQQDKIERWQGRWQRRKAARDTGHAPLGTSGIGRPPTATEQSRPVIRAQRHLDTLRRRTTGQGTGQGTGSGRCARRNLTDPDSRLMKTRRGWLQGYNAQFAVTADQVVLALTVTQDPTDYAWFTPMMNAAVDAATDIARSRPDTDNHVEIGLVLADAGYASDANLTAPGPDRLIALGKSRQQHRAARDDPASGDPPDGASAREQMNHRLRTPEGHAAYTRRGATVEPGIGNIKKLLTTLSRRGLAAAHSEITLAATVHNLLKLHRTRPA